jgi:hypothetical protein
MEVILRMLVVKRLYEWGYEETEPYVADSPALHQCCRVYLEPVPDDPTLLRWANLLGPATLAALNERVVALALVEGDPWAQAPRGQHGRGDHHSSSECTRRRMVSIASCSDRKACRGKLSRTA